MSLTGGHCELGNVSNNGGHVSYNGGHCELLRVT